MSAIFLSASVPVKGRGTYYESANPFLIQCAVRELIISIIRSHTIVWGGHPSITPMIWTICKDLEVDYSQKVVLYQSRFFNDCFPEENDRFGNVIFTDAIDEDREASLMRMREMMLSRADLGAAVFIGGMEGVEVEYAMFTKFHPNAIVLAVGAPGGAALRLADRIYGENAQRNGDVDFAKLFRAELAPLAQRESPQAAV